MDVSPHACARWGHELRDVSRWRARERFDLIVCHGVLHYLDQNEDAALPHLEKSFAKHWIARGMLGALRYRRKDVAGAREVLEDGVKANRKEGVLWATYAWILEKEGQHDQAIALLGRGVQANPSDDKLKASLQALQNGKRLKLGKLYEEQWFQFRLETPPTQLIGPGFRGGRRALYGKG